MKYEEMSETDKEMYGTCQRIAEKLFCFAHRDMLYDTEEGKMIDKEDLPDDYDDERYQDLIMYLLDDDLGVKIVTSLDGQSMYSCEICMGWGGPSIYVDTKEKAVVGYWGFSKVEYPLDSETCATINDAIDDYRSGF